MKAAPGALALLALLSVPALAAEAEPAAGGHAGHGSAPMKPAAAKQRAAHHHGMRHGEQGAMRHGAARPEAMDHGSTRHPSSHGDRPHGQTQADPDDRLPVPGMLPPSTVRALTDADRAAAFPALQGHTVHDKYLAWLLVADQLEYQATDAGGTLGWDIEGWIGGDIDRLWLRSEGERRDGETESAELQLLWGHAIDPWWEAVAGVRQDFKPGTPQTWAALGVQGTPLYGLETEATLYLGEAGQTAARLEADYDILLTNRLILQPTVEADFHGDDDPSRGVGSGLSSTEVGLRLRYEIVRQFAPYIGLSWAKGYGTTADLARRAGDDDDETRLVAGVRVWF